MAKQKLINNKVNLAKDFITTVLFCLAALVFCFFTWRHGFQNLLNISGDLPVENYFIHRT